MNNIIRDSESIEIGTKTVEGQHRKTSDHNGNSSHYDNTEQSLLVQFDCVKLRQDMTFPKKKQINLVCLSLTIPKVNATEIVVARI